MHGGWSSRKHHRRASVLSWSAGPQHHGKLISHPRVWFVTQWARGLRHCRLRVDSGMRTLKRGGLRWTALAITSICIGFIFPSRLATECVRVHAQNGYQHRSHHGQANQVHQRVLRPRTPAFCGSHGDRIAVSKCLRRRLRMWQRWRSRHITKRFDFSLQPKNLRVEKHARFRCVRRQAR